MHVRNVWTRKQGKNPRKLGHIMCWQPFFTSPFLFKEQDALFWADCAPSTTIFQCFHCQPVLFICWVQFFEGMGSLSRYLCIFLFFDHFGFCHLLPFRFVILWFLFCKPLTKKTLLLLLKTFLENSKHWIVLFFKNTKNPIFLCKRKMIAFKCENKGIFNRKGAVLQPIFLASNPWIASIGKGQQT